MSFGNNDELHEKAEHNNAKWVVNIMAKKQHESPMLDELEDGPWPSFVTGLKRLATDGDKPSAKMMTDLVGQLEHSYETRTGYW